MLRDSHPLVRILVQALLKERDQPFRADKVNTAIFYSISSTQPGSVCSPLKQPKELSQRAATPPRLASIAVSDVSGERDGDPAHLSLDSGSQAFWAS